MDTKAFSIPEMMVALGMMGIIAYGTMQLTQNSLKSQKKFEASTLGQAFFHTLNQQLLNSESCKNTLEAAGVISDGTKVTEIRNRENNIVYDTQNTYGNRSIKIDSITIDGLNGSQTGFAEFDLVVKFERVSSEISQGAKFTIHKIPIQAELQNGKVERCYAHTDNAVATAKIEACKNIGGVYNKESDICDLKDYDKNDIAISKNVATSTDFLEQYSFDNYLKRDGTNTMNADAKICIGNNCRDFKEACPVGSLLEKINPDGNPVCRSLLCDSTKFFNGIDFNGQAICKALPTTNCPTNQFIKQVNSDGTVVCENLPFQWGINCGPGKYIESIAANGVPVCKSAKDLIPDIDCPNGQFAIRIKDGKLKCKMLAIAGQICPLGMAVEGFDGDGNPLCKKTGTEKSSCVAYIATELKHLGANHHCHIAQCTFKNPIIGPEPLAHWKSYEKVVVEDGKSIHNAYYKSCWTLITPHMPIVHYSDYGSGSGVVGKEYFYNYFPQAAKSKCLDGVLEIGYCQSTINK